MSGGEPSDEDLVRAINRGDAAAFEALYFRYRDWTLRLAKRFTGDDSDALDVTQEVFVYLFRKFPGFALKSRMTTFLWPAVRNLSLQARRNRTRSLALTDAALDLPDPEPDRAPDAADDLLHVVSALNDEHRRVVLMRFVDDLTIDEIAELLDIPPGTVKSRLHTAIAYMRTSPTVLRYFDE